MKKLKEKIKCINYMHYLAIVITLAFVTISVLVFSNAYVRIWESFRDLWNSIKYYFKELFLLNYDVYPSVIDKSKIGFTPILGLPATWEEFILLWHNYWKTWISLGNFKSYLVAFGNFMFNFCRIILLVVVPIVLLSYIFFQRYLSKENNKYNQDSKPLKFTKWLATKTYIPIKNWCKKFIAFIRDNKIYIKLWLFIFLFNYNFIAIFIEFIAFYLFFVISFKTSTIYLQFYKLACDLSVMVAYTPLIVWFMLVYVFIVWWRKKIGYSRLNHFENKNCGFINERPIVLMLVGTMGKKKTTAISDIALSQEKMLRDKAFEKILDNDLKFPYFPWINLENTLKKGNENA